MQASGAILREVGTTNKTRIVDYERALNDRSAAILRCHTSNYRIVGFAEKPATSELVRLATATGLPFIDDVGSGALCELDKFGIADEPLVPASIKQGADLVLFSGDKLLGGPQCGVIVGHKARIEALARNPLMRALRVDKVTLAALAATLELYRHPHQAEEQIPVLRLLSTSLENLEHRARHLAPQLAAAATVAAAEPIAAQAQLGGGAVPAQSLPTWCVQLKPQGLSVDELARRLRLGKPPVFTRIQQDAVWLDIRTVFASQDLMLVDAVLATAGRAPTSE
jgi:L-seryl-tRNA(Ser) seleniumtransferase